MERLPRIKKKNIFLADVQGFFAQSYIHKVRWSSNANEANKHTNSGVF